MGRATLRRIRRLTEDAAPAIAGIARRRKYFKSKRYLFVQGHLLALLAIARYGEPRIDEPLNYAYERALAARPKATGNRAPTSAYWPLAEDMRLALAKETQHSKYIVELVEQEVPDWLLYYCQAGISFRICNYVPLSPPFTKSRELVPPRGDRFIWPSLPMRKLERCPDGGEDYLFPDEMRIEELLSFCQIMAKPEQKWTRREHQFMRQLFARYPSKHLTYGDAKYRQMGGELEHLDAGGRPITDEERSFPPRPLFKSFISAAD